MKTLLSLTMGLIQVRSLNGSRYLEKVKLKTDKTSFHSFRHNLKDFFRQTGESDELAENFMGRTTGTTGEAYEVVSLFSDSMRQYKRLALKIISLWNESLCQTYQSHISHQSYCKVLFLLYFIGI